jgi:hypothetical protein
LELGLRPVPKQNLAPEVQKRRDILQGFPVYRAAAFDLGAATGGISSKVSFCQCLSTWAAFPDKRADNSRNSLDGAGIERILAELGAPFAVPAQKLVTVETLTEILRTLDASEESHFDGLATGDESWCQFFFLSVLKLSARSPTDVITRTRQSIETKETMTNTFFTGHKLIVLDILLKGSKFSRLYFSDYIFSDLKRENVNFHSRIPQATF